MEKRKEEGRRRDSVGDEPRGGTQFFIQTDSDGSRQSRGSRRTATKSRSTEVATEVTESEH